ncbi:DUF6414 family protein [Peribacillus frigoritolerans]|uniref:DUF6414 family protein n=1 Tax=Peribacillus frigoritolerans TaxID=450367 RepID=UPI003F7D98BD
MKDIIYLDTDLMNSILAQLDEGLINSFSLEQSNQESETEGQQSLRGKSAGIDAQISADTGIFGGGGVKLGAKLGGNGSESTNESKTILEGQKDILNKAFHDYALDILLNKLIDSDSIKDKNSLLEGDLYLGESPYKFYDFELLKNILDVDAISKIMSFNTDEDDLKDAKRIVKKTNLNSTERSKLTWAKQLVQEHEDRKPVLTLFKQMEIMSGYFSNSLRDLSLIKANNFLAIIKKQHLRESPESLSLRPDNSRSVKYLFRIIGKKDKVFDGLGSEDLPIADFNEIPNMIFDIMLGSFDIIKKGDYLVTPIAIYYE